MAPRLCSPLVHWTRGIFLKEDGYGKSINLGIRTLDGKGCGS